MDSKSLEKMKVRTLEDVYNFSSIVLWGAGFAYEDTIELIGRGKITAVFDNDQEKWGKTICGFPIKSPVTDLEEYVTRDTAVIISTNGYQYEIATDLVKNKGIKENQIFCNSNKIVEKWRYCPEIIQKHDARIQKVYDKLADQESKEYYINFLKACLTRNPFYYKDNPRCVNSYEYKTELARLGLHGGEVILDCGAFNGDTARLFRKLTNNNCEVYCFEPVTENYNEMTEWIRRESIENVHAIHVGVGKEKHMDKVYSTEEKTTKGAVGTNRFNSKSPVVSEIQVDSLDNMLGEKKVDYIKMDIEGAEMDALRGGEKIIEKNHPQMLISAYHKIADMWEVPEFVLSIHPDYQLFLGHQPHAPYEPEFLFI
ncbi:MAG: FkbM family methyltransferase [Lachnospiraceae bacterium]|nr:FkbM family methyltransferase [Lachnospiraceae bacterium]